MSVLKRILILLLCFNSWTSISSQESFENNFSEGVMRIDFILAGNADTTELFLHKIIREAHWSNRKKNLLDSLNFGDYYFTVKDLNSGKLIFSGGFSTLFREWQTTNDAMTHQRSFSNSIRFPYPLRPVELEIFLRQKDQSLLSLKKFKVDPSDSMIELIGSQNIKSYNLRTPKSSESSIDIAILAEGYTKKEIKKFRKDATKLIDYMFSVEPFKSCQHVFNINLVYSVSLESGTDIPSESDWRNTVFNSNFCTFGIERYLTISDLWKVYDYASCVPHDQIIILVNSERYGGGGIYNFYSICTSDHELSGDVLVHEFGHAFAGLGDEYYTSSVTYEGFYSPEFEPWEPNLSTLKNFEQKWKDMVPEGIPIPTPPENKYSGVVGAFEGGGYISKGVFRPMLNCRMNHNSYSEFCLVCQEAIKKMIHLFTE